MRRPAPVVLAALVMALVLTGCTGGDGDLGAGEPPVSPLASCDGLTAPPPGSEPGRPDSGQRDSGQPDPGQRDSAPANPGLPPPAAALPPLSLSCFTGGEPFALAQLRGPAVVNLWASWCPPCRDELPALQRLADRAAGRVHVVGVVTADTRARAAALAADLDLRFPALHDPDEELLAAAGRVGLPVTLFVDREGGLRHVYQGEPFDEHRLTELVEQYLQVSVPAGAAGG
jgi:thiol-disulfide isomerase/thioredoxin